MFEMDLFLFVFFFSSDEIERIWLAMFYISVCVSKAWYIVFLCAGDLWKLLKSQEDVAQQASEAGNRTAFPARAQ